MPSPVIGYDKTAGVFFCQMEAKDLVKVIKLALVR